MLGRFPSLQCVIWCHFHCNFSKTGHPSKKSRDDTLTILTDTSSYDAVGRTFVIDAFRHPFLILIVLFARLTVRTYDLRAATHSSNY